MNISRPVDVNIVDLAQVKRDECAIADHKETMTFGQLSHRIRQVAALLKEEGLKPGECAIVLMKNSVDQIASHLAVLWAGGISVPLPITTPKEKLKYCYDETDASLIIADNNILNLARELVEERKGAGVICCNRDDSISLRSLDSALELRPAPYETGRNMNDTACLLYTTGSTGSAKAVVITHLSLMNSLRNIVSYLGYDGSQKEAVVLPLTHSFGLGHVYCCLITGGFCWVDDGLKRVKRVLDAIEKYEINGLPASPSLLEILVEKYDRYFFNKAKSLRYFVVNSAPLPPSQAEHLLEKMPEVDLYIYYGLTEASRSTFINLRDEPESRYASVGCAAPNVEVSIFSLDDQEIEQQETGEVCIRGDHIAKGYWKKKEETKKVFSSGWVRTGDLGSFDEDGYLTIHGRIKEQINVGGLKVLPADVERVLLSMPNIDDAAVAETEDPSGIRGSVVGAIVSAANKSIDALSIQRYCSRSLDNYMVPEVIVFNDHIPRAESGKILRGEVKDLINRLK